MNFAEINVTVSGGLVVSKLLIFSKRPTLRKDKNVSKFDALDITNNLLIASSTIQTSPSFKV